MWSAMTRTTTPRAAWLALAGLGLAIGCAGPQVPDRPLLPPQQFAQRLFNLPSGLRVLVQEDHRAELVAVATVVGTGSSADPAGQEGLAHLVEHLCHRGVDARLKRTGATYNATTEADRTTYYALAHREQLTELVAIEGRRLEALLDGVGPEIFDTERDVVRNEQRQRGGDPRVVAALFRQIFPGGHPMARNFPGGRPDLSAVTLASAREFVARHYRPTNIVVVIAGDVDPEQVAQLVGRWSKSVIIEMGATSLLAAPAPAAAQRPVSDEIHRLTVSTTGRALFIAWPLAADRAADDPFIAMSLAAMEIKLISGGWASVATPLVIESKSGSIMAIALPLNPKADPSKVRDHVLDAVANSRGDAVARWLMGHVKWVTGTTLMRKSTDLLVSTVAVAHHLSSSGRPTFYKDTLEQLAAVKPLAISDFLGATVSRDQANTLLVDPEHPDGQEGEAAGAAITQIDVPKHDLEQNEDVNLSDFATNRLRQMVRAPDLGHLPRFRLSNGLEVVVVPRPAGVPVAEVTIQLSSGNENMAPFGLAGLADDLSHNARGCSDESLLTEVGGTIGEGGGDWPRQHAVQVFAGNLANGFVALANVLRCRELDDNAVKIADGILRVRMDVRNELVKKPYQQAAEAFWNALYPDGAFGLRNRQTAALQALGEADYEAALQAQYRPAGALAVVVTDQPTAQLQLEMQKYLGGWTQSELPHTRPAPDAVALPTGRVLRLFQAESPQQDQLRFGCRLAPVTEATLPARDMLEAIVRREATQVRSSWGATYGFAVEVTHRPHGVDHLEVTGAVDSSRTADAVARLLKYVADLASAGPDIKSFLIERWDLGREFNRRFATGTGLANGVLEAAQLGWSPGVWDAYPENLAQLSRTNIRELLAPCAGHEIVTVIGDKAKLTTQLAALGFAP
jgi:zinc protease